MELKEVINKRRTVRDFKSDTVSIEIIKYAIENGFKAPSYNHLKEWDFIILQSIEAKLKLVESEDLDQNVDVEELNRLFDKIEPIKKEMYLDAIPKQKKMILDAPVVIVVVFKPKKRVNEAKIVYDLNCLSSVWTCIENFLLSLAEYEVYGVTYIPQNIDLIKEKLNIPDELEISAVIPIGYKADDAKILTQKAIDITEKMHFEKW